GAIFAATFDGHVRITLSNVSIRPFRGNSITPLVFNSGSVRKAPEKPGATGNAVFIVAYLVRCGGCGSVRRRACRKVTRSLPLSIFSTLWTGEFNLITIL